MLSKRTLLNCAAGLTILFAASGAIGTPAAADGGTVVIASTQVPRHFNGAIQSGVATAMPSAQIFASPLRYDDKWNPQPYLAESWEVAPDGLSVTLKLVKNAVFHDGKPVTSEDVAFSIMAIKANHPFRPMLAAVEKVDTPDPFTAIIRLSHPHPALLLAMSPALMPILPKHIYGDGQDIKSHPANMKPIGSGPFKLTEYKQGEHYTLEKFDKFFIPGRPKLDKVILRIFSDPNAAMVSVERGDVNMLAYTSNVRDIERFEKMESVTVVNKGFEGIGALNWLAFNTKKKLLMTSAFARRSPMRPTVISSPASSWATRPKSAPAQSRRERRHPSRMSNNTSSISPRRRHSSMPRATPRKPTARACR